MFEPRVPLVLAESVVEFAQIDGHIDERRATLERWVAPFARNYADSILLLGVPSMRAVDAIEERLYVGLASTLRFGYVHAEREIRALREHRGTTLLAADAPPRLPYRATPYLQALVRRHVHEFSDRMMAHWERFKEDLDVAAQMHDRARRETHNVVLELVGQVLNAGRSLAATGQSEPVFTAIAPVTLAMRTEQLDRNTCVPCHQLHGRVVDVLGPEYFALMPPALCRGGGRCRGFYVYGDSLADFEDLPGQMLLGEVA